MSQQQLQMVIDNLKPLQQAVLANRRGASIIIGGLSMGVLIYCGHRWLSTSKTSSAAEQVDQDKLKMNMKKKDFDLDKKSTGDWLPPQTEESGSGSGADELQST